MILRIQRKFLAILLCVGVVAAVTVAAVQAEPNAVRLPVIMYHHISVKQSALGKYVISPDQFREDLVYLRDRGYTTVTADQLIQFVSGKGSLPEKPVLITFDDGYESFYAYAFPILKELKMNAVLSIIGNYTEQYSNCDDHNINYAHVTWEQVAEMARSGCVDIGNHTYNLHTIKTRKGCNIIRGENEDEYRQMLREDVSLLQQKITETTGITPTVFAYPFGLFCSQGCEVIRDLGFTITLGCEEKVNRITPGSDSCLKMLKRFNRASGKSSEAFFNGIIE